MGRQCLWLQAWTYLKREGERRLWHNGIVIGIPRYEPPLVGGWARSKGNVSHIWASIHTMCMHPPLRYVSVFDYRCRHTSRGRGSDICGSMALSQYPSLRTAPSRGSARGEGNVRHILGADSHQVHASAFMEVNVLAAGVDIPQEGG